MPQLCILHLHARIGFPRVYEDRQPLLMGEPVESSVLHRQRTRLSRITVEYPYFVYYSAGRPLSALFRCPSL